MGRWAEEEEGGGRRRVKEAVDRPGMGSITEGLKMSVASGGR